MNGKTKRNGGHINKYFALAAVFFFVLSPFMSPRASYADDPVVTGPIESLVTKLAEEAIDFAGDAIIFTLDKAAEKTGYNLFTKAADLLSIPFGGSGDRETHKLCNEIITQLDDIDEKISSMQTALESQIAQFENIYNETEWGDDRRDLNDALQKYVNAYVNYQEWVDAVDAYNEALSDDTKTSGDLEILKDTANSRLTRFVDRFDPKTSNAIDFENDIIELARLCCLSQPTYKLPKPSAGTLPTTTLLSKANTACLQSLAYEHQLFETLSEQADECMNAFAKVAYVNRIWTDYKAHENGGTAPRTDIETQEIVINKCVIAINDIAGQLQSYAGSLMRPYDFEINAYNMGVFGYSPEGGTQMHGKNGVGYEADPKYLSLFALWTRNHLNSSTYSLSYQTAYQAKAIGRNVPFLLLKADYFVNRVYPAGGDGTPAGVNAYMPALNHRDINRWCWSGLTGTRYWSTMNQDFYNVYCTGDGNYTLISSAADLAYLVNEQSYKLTGKNDLFYYLKEYGGMDASLIPTDTALTRVWQSAAWSRSWTQTWSFSYDYVADMSNYNLNETDKELKKRVKTTNANAMGKSDWITNVSYKDLLVMLIGTNPQSRTIGVEQDEKISVALTDASDKNAISSGSRVKPGTTFTITMKSTANDFGELLLVDGYGASLDVLLTADAYDLCASPDGSIKLTTTMPYQNCMVRAVASGDVASEPASGATCTMTGFEYGELFEAPETVEFAASGESAGALAYGTQRLRPSQWQVVTIDGNGAAVVLSGDFSGDTTAGSVKDAFSTEALPSGMYGLKVIFARERYENGSWVDVGSPHSVGRAFTVNNPYITVKATSASINEKGETLTFDGNGQTILTLTISPAYANEDLTWTSSDEDVATIEGGAYGAAILTAVGDGVTAVTVRNSDGEILDIAIVTISGVASGNPTAEISEYTGGGGGGCSAFGLAALALLAAAPAALRKKEQK